MSEETRVDKDYKEAFNQGYEVAKELNLKSDVLEGVSSGNNRIQAMKDGMEQYAKEVTQEKEKDVIPPLDLDNLGDDYIDITGKDKDKERGKDIDI